MPSNPISEIAHKIRTPLTVIMSSINNILDGTFGSVPEEQRKWLQKVEHHTNLLEGLLNEMLDFFKKEPDKAAGVTHHLGGHDKITRAPSEDSMQSTVTSEVNPGEDVPLILVVDDEADIRDVVQEGLTMKGWRSVLASTGEEAIEVALRDEPDLILMDVLLQHQNGMEVCRIIKSKLKSFTPVILMTGQDDLRQKISGSPHEADDLLTKPFQMVELFTRVASMLRMKKLHDELQEERRKQAA